MRDRLARAVASVIIAGGLWAMLSVGAHGQGYPDRPIRWILGFPAGGTSDILARALGARMGEALGQPFVIDNRPGASGVIANDVVSRATPDGYTILLVSSTYANLISMKAKLPYKPEDLAPVSLLASVPNILVAHPSVKVSSVSELIALARKSPGALNYGTGGAGTGTHLASELFNLMAGTSITHIPYKGTPPAVNDLIAGRVQVMFALAPVVMPHVKANRLTVLAVSGSKRLPELPTIPTVGETVPEYEATTWYGLLVPKATPATVIGTLNREVGRALAMPDVVERLVSVGFQPDPSSPRAFAQYIDREVAKWARVIREAKISTE